MSIRWKKISPRFPLWALQVFWMFDEAFSSLVPERPGCHQLPFNGKEVWWFGFTCWSCCGCSGLTVDASCWVNVWRRWGFPKGLRFGAFCVHTCIQAGHSFQRLCQASLACTLMLEFPCWGHSNKAVPRCVLCLYNLREKGFSHNLGLHPAINSHSDYKSWENTWDCVEE